MLSDFRALGSSIWSKLLLAFLVLTFAVWGVADMMSHSGRNREIASVGGQPILHDEFAAALRRETEGLRQMMGDNFTPEMAQKLNLPQYVLQKLITAKLLQLESQSLGIMPGDADVVRVIRANPAYQDSKGNFDKKIFEAMLRNSNRSEKAYVEHLRKEMAKNLLVDTVSDLHINMDAAATTLYAARDEQRIADLYFLPPSLVANVPKPSEEALNSYYKDHAATYSAPEYRRLSYIVLTLDNLPANSSEISQETLKSAYQERIDEFKRPERRTVEQLLFNSEEKARGAYDALQSGKDFATVAKESDIMNKNALSLGTVERDKIIDGTGDAIFSAASNSYTEPVKSPFGWHIFHIKTIMPSSIASLDEVRGTLEKELKQRGKDEALYALANKLEDTLAGGSSLAEAAKEFNLTLKTIDPIDKTGKTEKGEHAKNLPEFDKFLDVAFKTEEKTESPLTTIKNGYYILRVDSITPERVRSLDEIKSTVATDWQQDERESRLTELAKDIAEKMQKAESRERVIQHYNLNSISSGKLRRNVRQPNDVMVPPALLNDIFSQPPGSATDAYPQLTDTKKTQDAGYIIAVVKTIVPSTANSSDSKPSQAMTALKKELDNAVKNELLEQYIRHIRSKYPVRIDDSALKDI